MIRFLTILALLLWPIAASAATPTRGIAVLASNVGRDLSADEVAAFCRTCKINLVVIDFAWITHHWPRTDFDVLKTLTERLTADGVRVAGMYRPRLLVPEDADVHRALRPDGTRAASHNDLCFAHADSRNWAARWGTDLLARLPKVSEVILYNVLPTCACPDCRDGRATAHVETLLRHCRTQWSAVRPGVRVGHVSVGTPYSHLLHTVYPFLPVLHHSVEQADIPVSPTPFLKTCWAKQTDNDATDVARALTACDAQRTGFVLWYYEWLFHPNPGDPQYDRRVIIDALGGDWNTLSRFYRDHQRSNEP